jgi:triosephosphate isomerase
MYFGHADARRWFARVTRLAAAHPAVADGRVEFFVMPSYLQVLPALEAFHGTRVAIGAQDVATDDAGAFTGEVSAVELAEVGVRLAEVGHAERRRLFGETDDVVRAKTAAALRNGLTPVLCLGEAEHLETTDAALEVVRQLHAALAEASAGRVIVAYEPVWAIGAPEPAPAAHIATVARALREALDMLADREGSTVIYGGSAGPGLLTTLGDAVDGLFLGRSAHDPEALASVLDEAATLADRRAEVIA